MRPSHYALLLLCLLLSACGNDAGDAAKDTTDGVVLTDNEAATSTAFTPAAEALAGGSTAAEVGGILLQNFAAVSDPTTGLVNAAAGRQYAQVAEQLADKFPGDTLVALPLYKAAEVVRALNDPQRAATIYDRVNRDYPTFSKAAESLFMLGFTYDEDLNQLDKAKTTYERFIKEHPTHGFADDAAMLIKNLGKSDEEILRELEEKAKQAGE